MNKADFTLKYFRGKGYGVINTIPCTVFYEYVMKYLNITNAGETADLMLMLRNNKIYVNDTTPKKYRLIHILVHSIMVNRVVDKGTFCKKVKASPISSDWEQYRKDE
jgi:hypothetical protein